MRLLIGAAVCLIQFPTLSQTPLIEVGDTFDFGTVTEVFDFDFHDPSDWAAVVDIDGLQSIVRNGELLYQEGTDLGISGPTGATAIAPGVPIISATGSLTIGMSLNTPTGEVYALYVDGNLTLQTGDELHAPGAPTGATWVRWNRLTNDAQQVLLIGTFLVGAEERTGLVRIEHDGQGTIVEEKLLAMDGLPLPNQAGPAFLNFSATREKYAFNDAGQAIFQAWVGDFCDEVYLFQDDQVLLSLGEVSPTVPGIYGHLARTEPAMNSAGRWAHRTHVTADICGGGQESILNDEGELISYAGMLLPGWEGLGGVQYGTFDMLAMGDSGNVTYPADSGQRLVVTEQFVTVQADLPLADGRTINRVLPASFLPRLVGADGVIAFRARASDFRDGLYYVQAPEDIGQPFCQATANSTGAPASIEAFGYASLSSRVAPYFVLRAESVPQQPGIFFLGTEAAQVPFGNGFRCVGGDIQRLAQPIFPTVGGVAGLRLELDNDAFGLGTTYFQFWYRDPQGGGAGFNLTDAVEITVVP